MKKNKAYYHLLNNFKYLLNIYLLSVYISISIEIVHRNSFNNTLIWIMDNPIIFQLNVLLILLVFVFTLSIIPFPKATVLIISYILVLSVLVSNLKMKYLGDPLLPWDLKISQETLDVATYADNFISIRFFATLLVFTVILVGLLYLLKLTNKNYVAKAIYGVISAAVLSLFIFSFSAIKEIFSIQHLSWDQKSNYMQNGFPLTFRLNTTDIFKIEEPEHYAKEAIIDILKTDNDDTTNTDPFPSAPNIIFIMNESFSDPTSIEGVNFSSNPLEFFHELQSEFTSGRLLSPVYGGSTANTEFEVLTGNSSHLLPDGAVAYTRFINQPIESLASILARQGYTTTAIHTYHNWFWNRDTVYKQFGFDKYISAEFFINPTYLGTYISDEEIERKIIEETERNINPSFIFATTMQNHSPYYKDKYPVNTISLEGNRLSQHSKEMLESYVQGLSDTDQSLRRLVEYYEDSGEPTVIILFGDHLPGISDVYKELDYFNINNQDYEEYLNAYSVPFVMWSNFPLERDTLFLNTSYLGAYVLNKLGLMGTPYFNFLNNLSKEVPIIPHSKFWDLTNFNHERLNDYRLLQYDNLFGEGYQFLGQLDRTLIVNTDYQLGDIKMELTNTFPESIIANQPFNLFEGKSAMSVAGVGIHPNATLFVNGTAVDAVLTPDLLTLIVEDKFFKKTGSLKLQLKILDSRNVIIAESNEIIVPIH